MARPDAQMHLQNHTPARLPIWLKIASAIWFVVWFPIYWQTWGGANFIHLCDIAVIITCIGIWTDSALLISSQAVSSLAVDLAWLLDVGLRLFRNRTGLGGTEYLFDPHYALWIRLLTLFHLVLPVMLLWGIYRLGYDSRAWALQDAIALPAFIAARFTSPAENINYAFTDPFLGKQWGPAPVHVLISWLFMCVVVYLPTHLALRWIFRGRDA
jgi:hypothetical protein